MSYFAERYFVVLAQGFLALVFTMSVVACEERSETREGPQVASASDSFDVVISATPSGKDPGDGGASTDGDSEDENTSDLGDFPNTGGDSGGNESEDGDNSPKNGTDESNGNPNSKGDSEDNEGSRDEDNSSSEDSMVEVNFEASPPGAKIVLRSQRSDSTWEGESPDTFTVPAGEYRWTVQKSRFREEASKISLQENQTLSPRLSRKRYVLEVATTPSSSTVEIQNVGTGKQFESQSPPHVFEAPFGRYTWTVRKPGYVQETSDTPITLRGCETKRVELSRERHVLDFNTTPASATATLRNLKTGETWTEETPHTFRLPPGQYEWTVQKDGFATQKSDGSIDLLTRNERSESIELTSTELPVDELIERGDKSFESQEYREAANYYEQVPPPSSGQDDTSYLQAQSRLARTYVQLENWEQAIDTYQTIIDRSPTQYNVRLNLARVYFEIESYEDAEEQLNRVNQLKQHIPEEKRREVTLQVEYQEALVPYQRFRNAQTPARKRNLALEALSPLRSFMERVPSELESDFEDELGDAREKLEEIRSFLE